MSDKEEKSQQSSLRGAVAGTGSSYQEALFGLMGGVVYGLTSPMVGHPLDTVKSKMRKSSQVKLRCQPWLIPWSTAYLLT